MGSEGDAILAAVAARVVRAWRRCRESLRDVEHAVRVRAEGAAWRPGWIRKVNADVQRMGARVVAQYAVLGPYDFVTIMEAPDNATISRVSVELGARAAWPA